MNHVYRLVWNAACGAWQAVAEVACGRGKGGGGRRRRQLRCTGLVAGGWLLVPISMLVAAQAQAQTLPQGGRVSAGSASISTSGNTLTVQQGSAQAVLDWQSFSIGSGATVQFVQPSASAVALNRVLGNDMSVIQGALQSNGRVFLVNPNGVLFGSHAQVNVGGLVASTLDISNADFMAGQYRFGGSSTAAVQNQGSIRSAEGGVVALVAARVLNSGSIDAPKGSVLLGAGQRVRLDLGGPVTLAVEQGALDALIDNGGAIRAGGGTVLLTAKAAGDLAASVINHSGLIEASSLGTGAGGTVGLFADQMQLSGKVLANGQGAAGGQVHVQADQALVHTGSVQAGGSQGGSIAVQVKNLIDAGHWDVSGSSSGGRIDLQASGSIEQTAAGRISADASSGNAGSVRLTAGADAWLSGTLSASSSSGSGGEIAATAPQLVLAGATLRADGGSGGGRVRVGGGWQGGDAELANAASTHLSASTLLSADAGEHGNGGTVVVWSDERTSAGGRVQARGGAAGGNGGQVEVSSHGQLVFGADVRTDAPAGSSGRLLLDPRNLTIDTALPTYSAGSLTYASPGAGDSWGSLQPVQLANGNIVVPNDKDDRVATDAGAVRLYDATGTLLSTLTGSRAGDRVGSSGVTVLSNGHFLVSTAEWANGAAARAGAVTWGNAATGVSGAVSAANSLVGSSAGDAVGSGGITQVGSGNYVVRSTAWNNAGAASAGAATWVDGSTGIGAVVSAANSLVGTQAYSYVGYSVTRLSNGNYVVASPNWTSTSPAYKGAATWGSGNAGVSGVVSAANSLVGSGVGSNLVSSVVALSNGNYVVVSPSWHNGSDAAVGAATWGNGSSGLTGVVSASNSIVGNKFNDQVGNGGVLSLGNGNFLVLSSTWKNGSAANAGAVTWGNGSTGSVTGVVSASNSLVGNQSNVLMGGGGITVLSNGNYVVLTPNWTNGSGTLAGAATWGSGTAGVSGLATTSNSLVGDGGGSLVTASVTALSNGNYVLAAPYWNNGAESQAGAVTWANGSTGRSGLISTSNSLVGSRSSDRVGGGGIVELPSGNYVVLSPSWSTATKSDVGAATWVSGSSGLTGALSASNSLIGSNNYDAVGSGGVVVLSNGNYVVRSPSWNASSSVTEAGAVTWGSGSTGVKGVVAASNSLVGSSAQDFVGSSGVLALSNGNYVVLSSSWSYNASTQNVGAATWGNGSSGLTGVVGASNSLTGARSSDALGSSAVASQR